MAVPFLVAWRALKGYLVPLFLLFLHFGTYFLPSVFCNQHQLPPQMSSIPFLPSPHPESISKDLSESPALAMRVSEQARTCLAPARSRAAALHLARLTRDARSCGWLRLRAAGWELHCIAIATTAVHTPHFYWQPLDVPHVTPRKKIAQVEKCKIKHLQGQKEKYCGDLHLHVSPQILPPWQFAAFTVQW